MFQLLLHKQAQKSLKKLNPSERKKVINKLLKLQNNPKDPLLDIKPFKDTQRSYRLRISNIRIIYQIQKKSIYIRKNQLPRPHIQMKQSIPLQQHLHFFLQTQVPHPLPFHLPHYHRYSINNYTNVLTH